MWKQFVSWHNGSIGHPWPFELLGTKDSTRRASEAQRRSLKLSEAWQGNVLAPKC